MPKVEGAGQAFRDRVGAGRPGTELGEGCAGPGSVVVDQPVHPLDDVGNDPPRVSPTLHGRRTGMSREPREFDREPTQTLHPGDDADLDVLSFEDRPLFDVQLVRAAIGRRSRRAATGPTESSQFIRHRDAVDVDQGQRLVERKHPTPHTRAHHGMGEPRPFLVGPYRQLDWRHDSDAQIVDPLDHLETSKHPVDTVEAATGGLGIQMASDEHGRRVRIGARPANEQVADLVGLGRTAGRQRPTEEQRSTRCVVVAQRLSVVATVDGGTDRRHRGQPRPQTIGVHSLGGKRGLRLAG